MLNCGIHSTWGHTIDMDRQKQGKSRMSEFELQRHIQKIEAELGQYRVLDEVGSDSVYQDHRTQREKADLASTREYEEPEAIRRIEVVENTLLKMAEKLDRLFDVCYRHEARESSTPTRYCPTDRPQEVFVQSNLDRERFDIPAQDGKHYVGDLFTKKLIPKPYMYVAKLANSSLKKKLEYRDSMTAHEYTNAFVAMLANERAQSPDHFAQLNHLKDVTHDAMVCKWPAVRAWFQFIFDKIEAGLYTWSDTQLIHNDRIMMTTRPSLLVAASGSQPLQQSTAAAVATTEAVCQDFNTNSCVHGGLKKHHVTGDVKFMHHCSYCIASSNKIQDSHATPDCFRKKRHTASQLTSQPSQQSNQPVYQHPNANGYTRYRQYTPTQQSTQVQSQLQPSAAVPKNL